MAVACVALMVPVANFSLAMALYRSRPEVALAQWPWLSRAMAGNAERVFGDGANAQRRKAAGVLASEAVARDPTNVSAFATLAFVADIGNDPARAERLFSVTERLSRRDLRTQLWLVERDVQKNDIPAVIRHYDIAMRVSPSARQTLFPILAGAITEPDIRANLIRTLQQNPNWGESFLIHAAVTDTDLPSVDVLMRSAAAANVAVPEQAWSGVVSRLADTANYDGAWRVYVSKRRSASRETPRAGDFRQAVEFPTAFDWVLDQDNDVAGGLGAVEPGLNFSMSPAGSRDLVHQVQLLEPGKYTLHGKAEVATPLPGAMPYWRFACIRGVELARIEIKLDAGGGYRGSFAVPKDCKAQMLSLVVPSYDGTDNIGVTINSVRIARVPD